MFHCLGLHVKTEVVTADILALSSIWGESSQRIVYSRRARGFLLVELCLRLREVSSVYSLPKVFLMNEC